MVLRALICLGLGVLLLAWATEAHRSHGLGRLFAPAGLSYEAHPRHHRHRHPARRQSSAEAASWRRASEELAATRLPAASNDYKGNDEDDDEVDAPGDRQPADLPAQVILDRPRFRGRETTHQRQLAQPHRHHRPHSLSAESGGGPGLGELRLSSRERELADAMWSHVRGKRHNRRRPWTAEDIKAFNDSRFKIAQYDSQKIYEVEVREAQNSSLCNYTVVPIPDPGGRIPHDLEHVKCNHVGSRCQDRGTYCCVQTYRNVQVMYASGKNSTLKVYSGCVCALQMYGTLEQYAPELDIND